MIEANEQDNLESYIQDLKKAAVTKKKTRFNGSQNRAIGGPNHPQLTQGTTQPQQFSHPQTTKNSTNANLKMMNNSFLQGQVAETANGNQAQTFQQNQKNQMQQQQSQQFVSGKRTGGQKAPVQGGSSNDQSTQQMQRTQSRGGSRAGYNTNNQAQNSQQIIYTGQNSQQMLPNQLSQSHNFAQGMMAPIIGQNQPNTGSAVNVNRANSRSNYRTGNQYQQQQFSQPHSATKDKTSQLLKNYEQIIRKEKESSGRNSNQNPMSQSQNFNSNNLIKRIPNTGNGTSHNKSLHNDKTQSRHGQRSTSNLRKGQGVQNYQQNNQQPAMNMANQKFYANQKQIINQMNMPNTVKNAASHGMSAQSGLQRAMNKNTSNEPRGTGQNSQNFSQSQQYDLHNKQGNQSGASTRGQKDVIIRKNSSKQFLPNNGMPPNGRPQSSQRITDSLQMKWDDNNSSALNRKKSSGQNNGVVSSHTRNKSQQIKKNGIQSNGQILHAVQAQIKTENGLQYISQGVNGTGIASPINNNNMMLLYNQNGPKTATSNAIDTNSTHANSEVQGSHSAANKRLRSHNLVGGGQQQQSAALNALAAAQNQIQNQHIQLQNSVGSVGTQKMMIDENQRRDLLLKNAKSLGNSLGTANKKTLNLSHQGGAGPMAAIEREQSTLNDQQFFTLAKTGLLNNLNLSQLIRSQNILDDDGIEDLHFYFVSFHNHKTKVLYNQEKKQRQRSAGTKNNKNNKSGPAKNSKKGKGDFTSNNGEDGQEKTIETIGTEDDCTGWND